MPTLDDYNQFNGRHWETGTVANYFGYVGAHAPHTKEPPSEALLMGISGGAVMGYFFFQYENVDPHVRILTRNTFNPWEKMLSRLGIAQNVKHTTKADKAVDNVISALEEGLPVVVWADYFTLPYNGYDPEEGAWGMFPTLVFGYEPAGDRVRIADRARVPLTVTTGDLHRARARVKKDKFRAITFDPPNWDKLPEAVTDGLRDCIRLYTEKPPKGSPKNFGFKAYENLTKMMTEPKQRQSWAKLLAGDRIIGGMISAYTDIEIFGKDGHAERDVYADFLEEAAAILGRKELVEAAGLFRKSAMAWDDAALALMPEGVPPLGAVRGLVQRRHDLFLDQGDRALSEILDIDERIRELRRGTDETFPADPEALAAAWAAAAEALGRAADLEREAVDHMAAALGGAAATG